MRQTFISLLACLCFGCAGVRDLTKGSPPIQQTINQVAPKTDSVRVFLSLSPASGFKVSGLNVRAMLSDGSYRATKTDANGEAVLFLPVAIVESWLVAAPGEPWVDVAGRIAPIAGDKETYRATLTPGGR